MAIPGDLNFDGIVNRQDLAVVSSDWLATGTGTNDRPGDANHDGIVNGQDSRVVSGAMMASNGRSVPRLLMPSSACYVIPAMAGLMLSRRGKVGRIAGFPSAEIDPSVD